jgi:hypothetical protein
VKSSKRRVCAEVAEVLDLVGARHMVVGHNVQPGKRARALCDGRCCALNHAADWKCQMSAGQVGAGAVL